MLKKVKNRPIKLIKEQNEGQKDVKNVEKTLYKWRYLFLALLIFLLAFSPFAYMMYIGLSSKEDFYPYILLAFIYAGLSNIIYDYSSLIDYFMNKFKGYPD